MINNYSNNHLKIAHRIWTDTSEVEEELWKIKNAPSRFKIVQIHAHGGKQPVSDKSWALLGFKPGLSVLGMTLRDGYGIEPEHLKYLLKDKREDEHYLLIIESCFGAGLVEDAIHNDPDLSNYTSVIPSQDLGTNHIIIYGDCANSPCWVANDRLFQFDANKTYSQQTVEINGLVAEAR